MPIVMTKKECEILLNWVYRLERIVSAEGYDVSKFYTEPAQRVHTKLLDQLWDK